MGISGFGYELYAAPSRGGSGKKLDFRGHSTTRLKVGRAEANIYMAFRHEEKVMPSPETPVLSAKTLCRPSACIIHH